MEIDLKEFLMIVFLWVGLPFCVLVGHMVVEYIAIKTNLGYPAGVILGLIATALSGYGTIALANKWN